MHFLIVCSSFFYFNKNKFVYKMGGCNDEGERWVNRWCIYNDSSFNASLVDMNNNALSCSERIYIEKYDNCSVTKARSLHLSIVIYVWISWFWFLLKISWPKTIFNLIPCLRRLISLVKQIWEYYNSVRTFLSHEHKLKRCRSMKWLTTLMFNIIFQTK